MRAVSDRLNTPIVINIRETLTIAIIIDDTVMQLGCFFFLIIPPLLLEICNQGPSILYLKDRRDLGFANVQVWYLKPLSLLYNKRSHRLETVVTTT